MRIIGGAPHPPGGSPTRGPQNRAPLWGRGIRLLKDSNRVTGCWRPAGLWSLRKAATCRSWSCVVR